jgi:hypothetical protein
MNGWITIGFFLIILLTAWAIQEIDKRHPLGRWKDAAMVLMLVLLLMFAYLKGTHFNA